VASVFYKQMTMKLTYRLNDEARMLELGAAMAALLEPGDVLALHGGLGVGKTTFTRGLVRALVPDVQEVPSPTYTLVQAYDAPDFPIWHFDLYRLELPDEMEEIGWEETSEGVAIVEWPDKAGKHLPAWRLDVVFDFEGEHRLVSLEPHGEDWQARCDEFQL
jgi:tRNA threonylcarbamoyladenosine biosynthesis protein TsaE